MCAFSRREGHVILSLNSVFTVVTNTLEVGMKRSGHFDASVTL